MAQSLETGVSANGEEELACYAADASVNANRKYKRPTTYDYISHRKIELSEGDKIALVKHNFEHSLAYFSCVKDKLDFLGDPRNLDDIIKNINIVDPKQKKEFFDLLEEYLTETVDLGDEVQVLDIKKDRNGYLITLSDGRRLTRDFTKDFKENPKKSSKKRKKE